MLTDPGAVAFQLCELEWMRQRLLAALGCETLPAFVQDLRDGLGAIDAGATARVVEAVDQAEDVIGAAVVIASLPDGQVAATRKEVEQAAARALEDGIADSARALHAASWVDVQLGLRTLATVLASDDTFRFWEIGADELIASFRGADAAFAEALAREAGVSGTTFAEMTNEQIIRLVAVLRGADAA